MVFCCCKKFSGLKNCFIREIILWVDFRKSLTVHFLLGICRLEECPLKVISTKDIIIEGYSVQFSRSVVSDSLRPHELQHARPPCPSPGPGVQSDSCPSSQWCHPAISSSVVPFSSCPQSLPASKSFPMSQLFAWGGQSISTVLLFGFYMPYSFFVPHFLHHCLLLWFSWFFDSEKFEFLSHFLLFILYSFILGVPTMGVTFNILKL